MIRKYLKAPLYILFIIAVGTLSCDTNYDKKNNNSAMPLLGSGVGMGLGCLMTTPITMESTTYDMDNNIIAISKQVIQNLSVQDSQPNMTSMYEMYSGVQLDFKLSLQLIIDIVKNILTGNNDPMALMGYVKQTPLLTQFWALKSMKTSINAGGDGIWMNSDDTIDPILGYFETSTADGRSRMITYSDYGVTPASRIDFIVENNKKTKTYEYAAGGDGDFGTDDDQLKKTTVYQYNSLGKMVRAINYSDDETTFVSSYDFEYDEKNRLTSMTSYSDLNKSKKLHWGSYSTCAWDDSGETVKLQITLGLQIPGELFFDIPGIELGINKMALMKFYYEFNPDGTIHKMIQYVPMSSSTIDTCYEYVYSSGSILSMGNMNDSSRNYSDDEETQVSTTINRLFFGEK